MPAQNGFKRYFNFLRQCGYGVTLPRGAVKNCLKAHFGPFEKNLDPRCCAPPLVFVYATKRCNLNCSFCVRGGPANEEAYELTPQKIQTILDDPYVRQSAFICFNGGEPLLNAFLPELTAMAKARGHLVGLITNGLRFGEQPELAATLIEAGICDMQLSIYDESKTRLAAILPHLTAQIPVHASYVLTRTKLCAEAENDFHDLLDTVDLALASGCSSLKFNVCNPGDGEADSPEIIRDEDSVLYLSFIKEAITRFGDRIIFSGYGTSGANKRGAFGVFFPGPTASSPSQRKCRTPWTILSVDAQGNYGLCCRLAPDASFGGLNAPFALSLRESLIDDTKPVHPACVNCSHLCGSFASDFF